jgi:ERCC4-type nuclease
MRVKPRKSKGIKVRANRNTELKSHIIPEDMVVVIDTREQVPLWMPKPPKGLVIMRDTLQNGDYSIKGHEHKFAIERKNSDLFAFLTSERAKTKEKLNRLLDYDFKALVIEYSEDELFMPQLFTNISPEVVRQSLISFEIKYGLHVYYGTKSDIERKVLDWMVYYFNYKRGGTK